MYSNLTQERLKGLFTYNPSTGVFVRNFTKGGKIKGSIAGCIDKTTGYIRIRVDGKKYSGHKLAWLYVYGALPIKPYQIDHIDRDRTNNSITNLRVVTQSENMQNMGIQKNNTSGVCGVHFRSDIHRWRARILIDGKNTHLGNFIKFSDAVNARKNAEVLYNYNKGF